MLAWGANGCSGADKRRSGSGAPLPGTSVWAPAAGFTRWPWASHGAAWPGQRHPTAEEPAVRRELGGDRLRGGDERLQPDTPQPTTGNILRPPPLHCPAGVSPLPGRGALNPASFSPRPVCTDNHGWQINSSEIPATSTSNCLRASSKSTNWSSASCSKSINSKVSVV